MTFIKKIFENNVDNNVDDKVHRQFTRFSKGVFENRALTKIKKSKDKFTIYASFDLANDLVLIFSGFIRETNISGRLLKKGKKQDIEEKVNSERLKNLISENDYCLIDINENSFFLKCKKAIPKPGKNLDPKFCSAALPLEALDELTFDIKENFKRAEISHTYIINEIVIPKEYENDPEKARIFAKRKGKIIRLIKIDGKEIKSEKEVLV